MLSAVHLKRGRTVLVYSEYELAMLRAGFICLWLIQRKHDLNECEDGGNLLSIRDKMHRTVCPS